MRLLFYINLTFNQYTYSVSLKIFQKCKTMIANILEPLRIRLFLEKKPLEYFDIVPYLSDKKRIREHTIPTPTPIRFDTVNAITATNTRTFRTDIKLLSSHVRKSLSIQLRDRRLHLYPNIDASRYLSARKTQLFKLIPKTNVSRPQ
jgi:hypothetical protein